MSKIILSSDSVCDLSRELIEKIDLTIMPLLVGLGEEYFQDGVDIIPQNIYDFVAENKKLPKTAARSIADYTDFFTKLGAEGEVIHFVISSDMSSSLQNAVIAAGEVGDHIHVIDSRNLSAGIGLLILDAHEMRAEGKSADEIVAGINNRVDKVRASFVVDTLDYLRMGGRCSAAAALGANMLKLHPCIEVKDGKMGVGAKYRGKMSKVIKDYADDKLAVANIDPRHVFVTHTECDAEVVNAVLEKVKALGIFENIYETEAGCTVNSHCGPGTLGVLYEVKE
ncbi:MAG: DegV family protein [Clostridia bacterium]|nr:DegV family protein [Clostridia bacterium]